MKISNNAVIKALAVSLVMLISLLLASLRFLLPLVASRCFFFARLQWFWVLLYRVALRYTVGASWLLLRASWEVILGSWGPLGASFWPLGTP